jgi:putative batD protein
MQAQIRFSAQIPSKAEVNGELRVQFVLTGAEGEGFTPPIFNDFEILAGPSVSSFSNVYVSNGRSSSQTSTTYTYILSPKRKGALKIGSASVHAGGKTYQTVATTVNVNGEARSNGTNMGASASSAPTTNNIQTSGSRISPNDLYLTADLNKKEVYEQEAVMLTYRYHAKVGVALTQISLSQKPELQGFWTQEIPESRNVSPKAATIGGKMYAVGPAFQYLVFPQQTGTLTIPSVSFTCDVAQKDDAIDEVDAFFNGGGMINKKVQVTSADNQLRVLPLPLPKPQNFSGGVGQFQVTAELISPQPRTNDIGTLRITVTGTGNLKLIKAPIILFPKDFDSYPAKVTDNVQITPEGITGNMQFDYNFVPKRVGNYTIPPVQLVYFDPNQKRYATAQTSSIALKILKGEKSLEETNAELGLRNSDIRPIQTGTHAAYRQAAWNHFGTLPFFIVLFCLLGSFTFIYKYLRKYIARHSDTTALRHGKAAQVAFKALDQLEKTSDKIPTNNQPAALKAVLLQYFADKLRCDRSMLTLQALQERLAAGGYPEKVVKQTEEIIQRIDFLEFAPSSGSADAQNLLAEIKSLLTSIEQSSK